MSAYVIHPTEGLALVKQVGMVSEIALILWLILINPLYTNIDLKVNVYY